ncbi:hypothetical protein SOCE26_018210 [Sorangium cellulosum]|uniref:Secreted protein n=1 Tax=Sorangium cellulosum TaxID=56 RepID=A0A2L0EMB3_SORCE|nr:hypothetical protein [Sorangium cellulosum]AUX40420.1 hypothetical protein SOCE26_018210 [Sorangium cellulosum]
MKRAALLLPIALLAACAGAPAPERGPAAPLAAAARPAGVEPAVVAAQPAGAQPVAAPAGLSSVLRIADPQRTWADVMQRLPGTPFGMLLSSAGPRGPEIMLEGSLGPALASLVDLNKPIDVALFGTTGARPVVSLAVPEKEVPRLHDGFALKEHRGLLRVERAREAKPDAEAPPTACAFEPGERRGGARLLCAEDAKDLEAAAPYLVKVVGREPIAADVQFEILGSTIREGVKDDPDADDEDDDSHAGRLGQEIGDALLRDLDSVSIDLTLGRAAIEVGLGMRFASRSSPFMAALAPAVPADAAPPPAFLRLPGDAAIALYTQGASRAELTPLREALFRAIRDDMVADGYDGPRLDRLLERLGGLVLTGGPLVLGAGGDRAAAQKALVAYQDSKGAQGGKDAAARAQKAARRALQGWILVAVEEPAQTWITGVKELLQMGEELDRHREGASAAGNTAAGAGAGAAGGAKKDGAPKGGAKKDTDKERTTPTLVRAPAALPAGTLHVELRTRPLTKDAPPAHTTHLYIVPAGQRTWIGISEDDAALVDRLRVATEPGRDARTLGAGPGAELAQQRGALAGGLFSLAGWAMLAANGETTAALDDAAEDFAGLAALPARGEVPMPLEVTSEVLGSGASRVDVRVRLPDAGIQDVIALLMR